MSLQFELPVDRYDGHIHGDGPHIGLTRPGFDERALAEVHDTLVTGGNPIADGAVVHTTGGGYGELALAAEHCLTEDTENKLRSLGFSGLADFLTKRS